MAEKNAEDSGGQSKMRFFDKGLILCKQEVVVTSSCLGFRRKKSEKVSVNTLGRHAKDLKMS